MQFKIFTLPVFDSERNEEEMNKFLRSHRIVQSERHFCSENGGYWTILVEFVDGEPMAYDFSFIIGGDSATTYEKR